MKKHNVVVRDVQLKDRVETVKFFITKKKGDVIWNAHPVGNKRQLIQISRIKKYGLIGLFGGSQGHLRVGVAGSPRKFFAQMVRDFWE